MPEPLNTQALEDVLTMAGGDRDFLVEVVEEYFTDSAANLAALRTASGAELERVAHTLKSTSASVGAVALAGVCADIENAARAGTVDPSLIALAETEHASARDALERHLEML
jgi:HPt (histidine-containing phosphotransfer) domain-containing protein